MHLVHEVADGRAQVELGAALLVRGKGRVRVGLGLGLWLGLGLGLGIRLGLWLGGLGAALLQVADDGVVQVGLRRALEHAKD